MHIDGEEIRLDPEQDRMEIAEDDWAIDRGGQMMRHMPTQVTFRVEMDEEAQKAGGGTVLNFIARPVHICSGHQLPPAAELKKLGTAAIVLFLYGSGLFSPEQRQDAVKPYCEPDLNLN